MLSSFTKSIPCPMCATRHKPPPDGPRRFLCGDCRGAFERVERMTHAEARKLVEEYRREMREERTFEVPDLGMVREHDEGRWAR